MTTTTPGYEEIEGTVSFVLPSLVGSDDPDAAIVIFTTNPREDGQVVEAVWEVPVRSEVGFTLLGLFADLFARGAAGNPVRSTFRPSNESDRYVSGVEALLAQVEASFPTENDASLDGFRSDVPVTEDELRERLTAEGIAHGNF